MAGPKEGLIPTGRFGLKCKKIKCFFSGTNKFQEGSIEDDKYLKVDLNIQKKIENCYNMNKHK